MNCNKFCQIRLTEVEKKTWTSRGVILWNMTHVGGPYLGEISGIFNACNFKKRQIHLVKGESPRTQKLESLPFKWFTVSHFIVLNSLVLTATCCSFWCVKKGKFQ